MKFDIPRELLDEPECVPGFWVSRPEEIDAWLRDNVRRGEVRVIGTSAGGRPISAVFYGTPRQGRGTSTFSGAIGCHDLTTWFGPDHAKKVYMAMAGVHGGELEGIMGFVNLVAVLETGRDLRGREWPEIMNAVGALDRLILLPLVNVDGRARIPPRMFLHRGEDSTVHEYLCTGARQDGSNIGWPACKRHIPLDFSLCQFPGGYPNDAGVNIQHDDFFSCDRQPETEALFRLTAVERPNLIVNMHTGAPRHNYFPRMHRPFIEPHMMPRFEALYRFVHAVLAERGLQSTKDPAVEADPARAPVGVYNLDTALNLHCGALPALIESPAHDFSGRDRSGASVLQTPDSILDGQLTCHLAVMRFLAEQCKSNSNEESESCNQ